MCITFYKFHVPVTFELTQLSHMKRTGHDEFATALCKQHKLDIGIELPVSLSRAPFYTHDILFGIRIALL